MMATASATPHTQLVTCPFCGRPRGESPQRMVVLQSPRRVGLVAITFRCGCLQLLSKVLLEWHNYGGRH